MIYQYLSIEWMVGLTAIVMLIMEACGVRDRRMMAYTGVAALAVAALFGAQNWNYSIGLLGGAYILDHMAVFFKELMLLITAVAMLISVEYVDKEIKRGGEFYVLMMFVCLGMLFLASAGDLVTIFISLEIVSMPLYVLAASLNYNKRSTEAGLKFFLLGALASAFFLLGSSLLFGTLGTLRLWQFPSHLASVGNPVIVYFALTCVLAALGFKIAAAPFHMWAPDVYQGAPTPVTAFLSTGPKVAGVAVLMRLLLVAFNPGTVVVRIHQDWILVISVMALLSMTVGNLVAMHQTNIKRLMAFSGIAHMGYILVGLAAASQKGSAAVMFYVALYTLTTLGAWAVVVLYGLQSGSEEIRDMAGLSRRSPILALILMLAFLSLAGLPPLAGFIGKFYLFAAAWESGLRWLAVIGIINSVASLYYYLGVLRVVYFQPAASEEPLPLAAPFAFPLALSTVAIVVLGLCPPFTELVFNVASTFMRG